MKVLVSFTIETEDFAESEFRNEIEILINDIDPNSKLEQFRIKKVDDYFDLFNDFIINEPKTSYRAK